MDVKDSIPVLKFKRHLQKYVRKLLSDIKEIEARETASKKEVASLANLLEQTECVAKVNLTGTALASNFPDVKSRLLVKISAAVEVILDKLKGLMEPLKNHNTTAYNASEEAMNILRQHSSDLGMDTLSKGEPTIPPLLVMIDWVNTVERLTRELYHMRMHYLDNLLDKQVVSSETLVSLWFEHSPELLVTVKDYTAMSFYFVKEKH